MQTFAVWRSRDGGRTWGRVLHHASIREASTFTVEASITATRNGSTSLRFVMLTDDQLPERVEDIVPWNVWRWQDRQQGDGVWIEVGEHATRKDAEQHAQRVSDRGSPAVALREGQVPPHGKPTDVLTHPMYNDPRA